MNDDDQQGPYPQQPYSGQSYPTQPYPGQSYTGPTRPGQPGFPPGGWQQMPPQQPMPQQRPPKEKKHRALKFIGGTAGALVILGIIISAASSGGSGSAPVTATQPSTVASTAPSAAASTAPSPSPAAHSTDAACQLLPTIESQIKAGNYDTAQRDAQHAEDLASKEGSLSSLDETADFGELAMDLIDVDGIDHSTVDADLATVTDDCK
jgi:hypothetical protein